MLTTWLWLEQVAADTRWLLAASTKLAAPLRGPLTHSSLVKSHAESKGRLRSTGIR